MRIFNIYAQGERSMKRKYALCFLLFIVSTSWLSFGNVMNTTSETGSLEDSSITTKDWPDAWIIIGGDRSDHHLSYLVQRTMEWVYDALLALGYTDDLIYYLVSDYEKDNTTREDGVTSRDSIHDAITYWARGKVPANGVLGIYMHDHGGENGMAIAPDGNYIAFQMDMDLDQFTTSSGCDRIFIIYEACYAGSFIDELSQSNRIILASTDPWHSGFWSPISPYLSIFGEAFFTSIQAGNSMGKAFCDAAADVIALGYGQDQFPCIDDNHDDVGHMVNAWGWLPSTGDGYDALNTYICPMCSSGHLSLPKVEQLPLKGWVAHTNPLIVPVQVKVWNSTPIASVMCRVVCANWTPPLPIDNDSMIAYDPGETVGNYHWPLTYDGDGTYSGILEITNPFNNSDYRLNFIIEDIYGTKGRIETTWFGVNGDGMPPLDTSKPELYIINPASSADISGIVNITAKGYDDQELEEIKIYFDGTLVNTTTMPNYLPYPNAIFVCDTTAYSNGLHNITATAKDNAGNTNTTSLMININNQPIPSFQIISVVIGCLLAVITIQVLIRKKNELGLTIK